MRHETRCTVAQPRGRQSVKQQEILKSTHHEINKTVAKWKRRETVADGSTRHKEAKSTSGMGAIIIAFRRHTLLPPDDPLYASQPIIPHLTRSTLHRYL